MRLYLVQHGEAKDKSEDPDRPLTEKGRNDVTRVGELLAKTMLQVRAIWHSGKTRAMETARILSVYVEAAEGTIEQSDLGPTDDVEPVCETLETAGTDVMIVGHLPFLDRLASLLVADDDEAESIAFQKGGVLCLQREDDNWSVAWMITPDILPR
ncbi:MAG: phosphohistidine phosphatase SixA [Planctomycetes bacterium]|jgi:phosphohistidine phosphatase|nr:phosphohistidine phosphatase SixA [Phycisphaerae bacterium]NBB94890.1 phosphohistidine phosphatase SixA [Planctomycetota bacterium]